MSDLTRLGVTKTYKLYVNGAFPRSESGRTSVLTFSDGTFAANVARASRKDLRDAVVAARAAQAKWAGATGYLRGQVLLRLGEMMESRHAELVTLIERLDGVTAVAASDVVDEAIDTVVWYAGWPDKLAQVLGSVNPVAGPYLNLSTPRASGVAAVFPVRGLVGLAASLCAPVASGNSVVLIVTGADVLLGVVLGEMLAVSDVPGGVVNILTGDADELGPWASEHRDVDVLDLAGLGDELAGDLRARAAGSIKRTPNLSAVPGRDLARLRAFVETTTVWHTVGR